MMRCAFEMPMVATSCPSIWMICAFANPGSLQRTSTELARARPVSARNQRVSGVYAEAPGEPEPRMLSVVYWAKFFVRATSTGARRVGSSSETSVVATGFGLSGDSLCDAGDAGWSCLDGAEGLDVTSLARRSASEGVEMEPGTFDAEAQLERTTSARSDTKGLNQKVIGGCDRDREILCPEKERRGGVDKTELIMNGHKGLKPFSGE